MSKDTDLVWAKVYFKKEDFGKMLQLKNTEKIIISDVKYDNFSIGEGMVISIVTTRDNITSTDRFYNVNK